MKVKLIHFIFLILNIVGINISEGQIYSEAPVKIDHGVIYSDMIYVKFRNHDVIYLPRTEVMTNGMAISNDYPVIKQLISEFCSNRQLSLRDISIYKAIPKAEAADTMYFDPKTEMICKRTRSFQNICDSIPQNDRYRNAYCRA